MFFNAIHAWETCTQKIKRFSGERPSVCLFKTVTGSEAMLYLGSGPVFVFGQNKNKSFD